MKFGHWLKHKREVAGISQGDVAKHFSYAAPYISAWERGIARPPVKILDYLAALYLLDPKELDKMYLDNEVRLVKAWFKDKRGL